MYWGAVVVVRLSDAVKKDLKKKVPGYVAVKLLAWSDLVRHKGLLGVRKIKSYHDEPLKGKKAGRRSIRLSKQWRAEYVIKKNGVEFILVEEVHPHDY